MPAKRPPQTAEQTLQAETERHSNSPMYRRETMELVDERISENVSQAAEELSRSAKIVPVSLLDTQRIVDLTLDYMRNCAASSTIPSISGLTRSMGLSRSTFYDCVDRHSPKETAEFFERVHDTFAELMSNATLRNEVNVISGIFLLKSLFKFRDSPTEIVLSHPSQSPYDGMTSDEAAAAIMEKYADLIDD